MAEAQILPRGHLPAVSGAEVIFHSTYGVTDAAKLTGAGQYSLQSDILVLDGTLSASNFHVEGGTLKGTHHDHKWRDLDGREFQLRHDHECFGFGPESKQLPE